MENELNIRTATAGDIRIVYDLLCRLEEAQLDWCGFETAYEANLTSPDIFCYLAIVQGQPVGFISLHIQQLLHHAAPVGEIQELIVLDGHRGRFIGKVLFEIARETALGRGCVQLEVCCRKERAGSHLFYGKMGMHCSHDKLCLPLSEGI